MVTIPRILSAKTDNSPIATHCSWCGVPFSEEVGFALDRRFAHDWFELGVCSKLCKRLYERFISKQQAGIDYCPPTPR